jgi:hypothetical protein
MNQAVIVLNNSAGEEDNQGWWNRSVMGGLNKPVIVLNESVRCDMQQTYTVIKHVSQAGLPQVWYPTEPFDQVGVGVVCVGTYSSSHVIRYSVVTCML